MNHLQKYELAKYAGAMEGAWAGLNPEIPTYGGVGANTGASVGLGGKPHEVSQVQKYRKQRNYQSDYYPRAVNVTRRLYGPDHKQTKLLQSKAVANAANVAKLKSELAPEFQGER